MEDETIELAAPTRSGYNFNGWTPTGSIPKGSTGDKTFTASWTSVAPTAFLVRFVDFDGTLLKIQWVHVGNGATAPAEPDKGTGSRSTAGMQPFNNITGPADGNGNFIRLIPAPVVPAAVPDARAGSDTRTEETPEAAPTAEPEVTPTPAPEVIEEEDVR